MGDYAAGGVVPPVPTTGIDANLTPLPIEREGRLSNHTVSTAFSKKLEAAKELTDQVFQGRIQAHLEAHLNPEFNKTTSIKMEGMNEAFSAKNGMENDPISRLQMLPVM